jgi:alcohol dehydrogenase
MVLSYAGKVLSGSVPYSLPPMPFVPGTNAIARVVAAGGDVTHVRSGDRVFLSPHLRGDAPDLEPPQILIGLTATVTTPAALALQARWRDGVFAEIAHWPAACVTPLTGLDDKPAGGPRVVAAVVSGEANQDLAIIRNAAGGSADVALDLLGSARSTSTTLSSLRALKRGGRLVVMGSAEVPLEISFRELLANDWEIVGQFMYERHAPSQLAALAAGGLLDLGKIKVKTFKLDQFKQAVEAAASMQGLDLTAVMP